MVGQAAIYHDLGKLDERNQEVLEICSGRPLPLNHVDAGTAYLLKPSGDGARPFAAMLVYSHHRGLPSFPDEEARGADLLRDCEHLEDGKTQRQITDIHLDRYVRMHHERLFQLQDLAATATGNSLSPLAFRMALSCLVDADHSDTAAHYRQATPPDDLPLRAAERLKALDGHVSSLAIGKSDERTRLKNEVYDACRLATAAPGKVMACDSAVGTGKTTAVMAHLLNMAEKERLRHIFVILPYTNIINQSVERYREALVLDGERSEDVVAAHHHRVEFSDPASRMLSTLWRAPVTVTTAVQFFETLASKATGSLRKLHELPGSAVFIDEAHAALPARLWPQALSWLSELAQDWGCYFVLASGSLSRFWELEEFSTPPLRLPELIPKTVRGMSARSEDKRVVYRTKTDRLDLLSLIEWVHEFSGPRLLILNTVQSAAAVAREISNGTRGRSAVEHISTALAPIDREKVLEWISVRLADDGDNDWTLVATSCVEAGMDFSFRTGFRERCGVVNLVQTGGRVNRNAKPEFGTAEVWDFEIQVGGLLSHHPAFDGSARILGDFLSRPEGISANTCTEALRQEVRWRNMRGPEEDPIIVAERNRRFPTVQEEFRVIGSDTVIVLVDPILIERIEKEGYRPSPVEIQNHSVQIWREKGVRLGLRAVDRFPGLFAWTLRYDDFLGYMRGVLEVLDGTTIV
jgi:CRISPR-associated endonuclease/helicase Cas3